MEAGGRFETPLVGQGVLNCELFAGRPRCREEGRGIVTLMQLHSAQRISQALAPGKYSNSRTRASATLLDP